MNTLHMPANKLRTAGLGFAVGAAIGAFLLELCSATYCVLSGNIMRGSSPIDPIFITIGLVLGGISGAVIWARQCSAHMATTGTAVGYLAFFLVTDGAITAASLLQPNPGQTAVTLYNFKLGLVMFGPAFFIAGGISGRLSHLVYTRIIRPDGGNSHPQVAPASNKPRSTGRDNGNPPRWIAYLGGVIGIGLVWILLTLSGRNAMAMEIRDINITPNPVKRGDRIAASVRLTRAKNVEAVLVKTTTGETYPLKATPLRNAPEGELLYTAVTTVPLNAGTGPEPLTIEVTEADGNVVTRTAVVDVR